MNLFTEIAHKGEKINLDLNTISLKNLIPGKHRHPLPANVFYLPMVENTQDYYTYDGSLTTPMCYESVRWIVFRERVGLSRNQVIQSKDIHSSSAFFPA